MEVPRTHKEESRFLPGRFQKEIGILVRVRGTSE
jgi:hypothetical protein